MSVAPSAALSASAFEAALEGLGFPLEFPPTVACSGGPDSMALAFLADRWAQARGGRARAVIVNHGLRADAAEEATRVQQRLAQLGLDATVLTYEGPRPTRDIQAAARTIRYRLIGDWMAEAGTDMARTQVMLAHHLEDQAETVLLRLARGSGVDGLSAMAPVSCHDGLTLLRPLLGVPRDVLQATLASQALPHVEDPSNRNTDFSRVRMRALSEVLAAEGLTPMRLAKTAKRMARARDALQAARDRFFRDYISLHPEGFLTFDPTPFVALEPETAMRVLSEAVRVLGGRFYPPREQHLSAVHTAILGQELKRGRTLAGARVLPWRGKILICREEAGIAPAVPADGQTLWDNRFQILEGAPGDTLGALGAEGQAQVKTQQSDRLDHLPAAVRRTLPALWREDNLLAVPHLGYTAGMEPLSGKIRFRPVGNAWGPGFNALFPFSKPVNGPM